MSDPGVRATTRAVRRAPPAAAASTPCRNSLTGRSIQGRGGRARGRGWPPSWIPEKDLEAMEGQEGTGASEILPPPPRRRLRRAGRLLGAVLLFVVAAAGAVVVRNAGQPGCLISPGSCYVVTPGPAENVEPLVRVEGARSYPPQGELMLTTVRLDVAGVQDLFRKALDPSVELLPRSLVNPHGLSEEEQDELNLEEMEASKERAAVAALRFLGYEVRPEEGVKVMRVLKDTPARGVLEEGDVIIAVDGRPVKEPREVSEAVKARRVGEKVSFTVRRGGETLELSVGTIESTLEAGKPMVGAVLETAYRLPFKVAIETKEIGGPSAGLVFALAIVDHLTPGDLTGGHRVAGTGTLDEEGKVGPVGGVAQKVRAAEASGAEFFLVPREDLSEARKAARRIRVVGVSSLKEAVDFLISEGGRM